MSEEEQLMQLWSGQENKVNGRYATAEDIYRLIDKMTTDGTPIPPIKIVSRNHADYYNKDDVLEMVSYDMYEGGKTQAAYDAVSGALLFPDDLRMNEHGMYAISHELMHYFDDLKQSGIGDKKYYSKELYSQNPMDKEYTEWSEEWDTLSEQERNRAYAEAARSEYWSDMSVVPNKMRDFWKYGMTDLGEHPDRSDNIYDSGYYMDPQEIMAFSTAPTATAFQKLAHDRALLGAADNIIANIGPDRSGEVSTMGNLALPRDPKITTETFYKPQSLWDGIKELFGGDDGSYEETWLEDPGVKSPYDITDIVQYINTIKGIQAAGEDVTSGYLTPFGKSLYDFTRDEISNEGDFWDAYEKERYLDIMSPRGGLKD